MEENEIDRILADIIAGGEISAEDRSLLEEWKRSSGKNLSLADGIWELARSGAGLKSRRNKAFIFGRVEQIVRKRQRARFVWKFTVAASVALAVGISVYFMLSSERKVNKPIEVATGGVAGVAKAELVLPHGDVILLDTTTKVLALADGLAQVIGNQNTLVYNSGDVDSRVEYHTIRVPRGGEYNLQLADSTKVYLNAGSSLRYPVRFTGDKREVELTGEGYFEVAKDTTQPFVVKAGNIDVRVLGTVFNVNAYPENEVIATTLVEGKVQVNYGTGTRVITPGMQLVYNKQGGDASVKRVDVEIYTSWKDGYYYFKQETLENIMDILVRWYDLNIFYQTPDLKDLEFGGRLRRYEDIEYLLQRMEETQDVEFIIKGNTITVKKKNRLKI